MDNVTLRIGRGPQGAPRRPLPVQPRRTITAQIGSAVDRLTTWLWGALVMSAILAPYLALKPATSFWWWP